ncbi:MAG: thymidine phosphorylase, partial [Nitrosopumilus sp. CG10_big_fil_rev_8_21_14_0_10_33_7]
MEFTINKMLQILKKSNGCIMWGGAIELAPADDIFVKTEFSLHIDPLLLPSIMSKKKAVG